jgi:hypothetical protein
MTTVPQSRPGPKSKPNRVREWFYSQVTELFNPNPRKALQEMNTLDRARYYVLPGRMYMFMYAPKYEEILPYYDRFPLVIPFSIREDGFTGINMHYLPPVHRKIVMDALLPYLHVGKSVDASQLRITYNILQNLSVQKYFMPGVKSYLNSHIRSRIMIVPVEQWSMVLDMPFERFIYPKKPNVTSRNRT